MRCTQIEERESTPPPHHRPSRISSARANATPDRATKHNNAAITRIVTLSYNHHTHPYISNAVHQARHTTETNINEKTFNSTSDKNLPDKEFHSQHSRAIFASCVERNDVYISVFFLAVRGSALTRCVYRIECMVIVHRRCV